MPYSPEGSSFVVDPYRELNGIYSPPDPVSHREDEYDSQGFELLGEMQHQHFWYAGRHRFLLHAVQRHLTLAAFPNPPRVIDLGGGCGGWLAYFLAHNKRAIAEAALADSSEKALQLATDCLPADVSRYHIDLLALQWKSRWEVAFLLDVLEHLPEDRAALMQIREALTPHGTLFITTPALQFFWTWNDEVVGHQKRYSCADFRRLAQECGFRLLQVRYFMFFLSPLLFASRLLGARAVAGIAPEDKWRLVRKMHEIPHPLVNGFLAAVFACETPLGHWLHFPWGTSVLAVLQRA